MANSANLAFCLEYSNHKTDMMNAFEDYLRNESMVDVMLTCEGRSIKAHKVVLSAGSTYFADIFKEFKNPFQFPVLIIKDMPFRDLKAIVEFLYRGEVVVPVEQVSSLSKSAQTLLIKGLEKYFNKSAVVDVANHTMPSASTHTTSTSSAQVNKTSVNTNGNSSGDKLSVKQNFSVNSGNQLKPKSKANTNANTCHEMRAEPKRSIGMSLRNTRRPNYRQLSNGDFNSEDEFSEDQFNGDMVTQVPYSARHLSRRVKSELLYNENYETEDGMPHLEAELAQESDALQVINTEEDNLMNSDEEEVYEDDYLSDVEAGEGPSTANLKYTVEEYVESVEPRGLIRNPVSVIPRRANKPFISRNRRRKSIHKGNDSNVSLNTNSLLRTGGQPMIRTPPMITGVLAIKADPDKVEIIHCNLCPRVFSQTSSLSIHMKRIHGNEQKEHICELCGKKYAWRSGLYKHMRTHR